jgi:hypothetical protein
MDPSYCTKDITILKEYILHSRYVCNPAISIEEQLLYRKQTSSPSLSGLLIFVLIASKGQPCNSIVMFDLFFAGGRTHDQEKSYTCYMFFHKYNLA